MKIRFKVPFKVTVCHHFDNFGNSCDRGVTQMSPDDPPLEVHSVKDRICDAGYVDIFLQNERANDEYPDYFERVPLDVFEEVPE